MPAVAKRPMHPVLGHVLIEALDRKVRFHSTDLETSISVSVPAQTDVQGAFTVPARFVYELLGTFPSDVLSLSVRENVEMTAMSGKSVAQIRGIDATEFPMLGFRQAAKTISIPVDVLRDGIGKTVFAAATDESRPVLTGVLFKIDGNKLIMAAADGFRLSVFEAVIGEEVEEEENEPAHLDDDNEVVLEPVDHSFSAIVPATGLAQLNKLLADEKESVAIEISESQIVFHAAGDPDALSDIVLRCQLIEGNFVNYQQIVPKQADIRVTVDRSTLRQVCKRAALFASKEANVLTLTAIPAYETRPASLHLFSESAEFGNYETTLEARVTDEKVIAMNVHLLLQALEALDGDEATFEMQVAAGRPMMFRSNVGASTFTHVIMPMHIRNQEAGASKG